MSKATIIVERMDDMGAAIAQLQTDVAQIQEDIGAILEKMDSETTGRKSDLGFLRGRIEATEKSVPEVLARIEAILTAKPKGFFRGW